MSWLRYLRAWWHGLTVHVYDREDDRLGRHQLHNPKAWLYDARSIVRYDRMPTKRIRHKRYAPVWDQGQVGACTAAAALGVMSTGMFWVSDTAPVPPAAARSGLTKLVGQQGVKPYVIADAYQLYREESRIDDETVPGHWEPDDVGSTGDWSMQALRDRGLIDKWVHAFRWNDLVRLLARQPVSIGIPWYREMFEPDSDGYVHLGGPVDGGHQICFDEIVPVTDARGRIVDYDLGATNTYGTSFGQDGRFYVSGPDMRRLLADGGDVVSPVLR